MRKTNNVEKWNDGNTFFVVYDPTTSETLTFFDPQGDPTKSEWKELYIEEGVGTHIEQVESAARFTDPEEAEHAAAVMADYLASHHPDEDVELEVRRIRTEMAEMVVSTGDFVTVTGRYTIPTARPDEDRTLDLMEDDEEEETEEDQEEEDEEDTVGTYWTNRATQASTQEETPVKPKKVKKVARSKSKSRSAKK